MNQPSVSYLQRRGQIEHYFDRTAADNWARLTSDAPVSGIRATVRAGRDQMRAALLSWLPADLTGRRVLDAGCGTGALAVEAARRGAHVTAVDLSPTLVRVARERVPQQLGRGRIDFRVGDLFDPALGRFDHVVCMDSLIHYDMPDILRVLSGLAASADTSIAFTFAPRTALLAALHATGKLFPRGDRAPMIVPVAEPALRRAFAAEQSLAGWTLQRTQRVARGFYISQAMEAVRT